MNKWHLVIVAIITLLLANLCYQVGRLKGIVEMAAQQRELGSVSNVTAPTDARFTFPDDLDCWAIFIDPKTRGIYPGYFKSQSNGNGGHMCTSDAAKEHLRETTRPSEYEKAVLERIGIHR